MHNRASAVVRKGKPVSPNKTGDRDVRVIAEFCHVFDGGFNIVRVIQSFLGLATPYNFEWWFLGSYVAALILGYVSDTAYKRFCGVSGELFLLSFYVHFVRKRYEQRDSGAEKPESLCSKHFAKSFSTAAWQHPAPRPSRRTDPGEERTSFL